MTSIDLKMTSNDLKPTSKQLVQNKKNKLKGDAIEFNEQYLDEIVHINII